MNGWTTRVIQASVGMCVRASSSHRSNARKLSWKEYSKSFIINELNYLFSINKPWMCCDIVHEDDTICSSIIQVCYCPITFLSCCVPYLSSHLQRLWIILYLSLYLSWPPPRIVMIYLFQTGCLILLLLFVFKLCNSSVTLVILAGILQQRYEISKLCEILWKCRNKNFLWHRHSLSSCLWKSILKEICGIDLS